METPFAAPALGCLVASSTPCTASPHVGWDDVVSGGTHSHSVDVSLHGVLALWLVCVLPLAYATRTRALGAVCGLLCAAWFAAFAFRDLTTFATLDRWAWLAPVLLMAGAGVFGIGGLHYAVPGFDNVARGSRIAGLQVATLSLFSMTFEPVAAGASFFNELRDLAASTQVQLTGVCGAVVTVASTFACQLLPRARERVTKVEPVVNVLLVVTSLTFVFLPLTARSSAIAASVVLLSLLVPVFVVGIRRGDSRLMRVAGGTLTVFAAVRTGIAIAEQEGIPLALVVAASVVAVGLFSVSFLIRHRKRPT